MATKLKTELCNYFDRQLSEVASKLRDNRLQINKLSEEQKFLKKARHELTQLRNRYARTEE